MAAYHRGSNKNGQLGLGSIKQGQEQVLTPQKVAIGVKCTTVSCGGEFTMWLSEDGALLSAGKPEFGQLGHGKTQGLPSACLAAAAAAQLGMIHRDIVSPPAAACRHRQLLQQQGQLDQDCL